MTNNEKTSRMNNPTKEAWRVNLISHTFALNAKNIKRGDKIVILLGDCLDPKTKMIHPQSELAFWLSYGAKPEQIVAVECKKSIYRKNMKCRDPRFKKIDYRFAPLSSSKRKLGGIEGVVHDLVSKGIRIAVVNADLMKSAETEAPIISGIAHDLGKQKAPCVFPVNLVSSLRNSKNIRGLYNVHETLMNASNKRKNKGKRFVADNLHVRVPQDTLKSVMWGKVWSDKTASLSRFGMNAELGLDYVGDDTKTHMRTLLFFKGQSKGNVTDFVPTIKRVYHKRNIRVSMIGKTKVINGEKVIYNNQGKWVNYKRSLGCKQAHVTMGHEVR